LIRRVEEKFNRQLYTGKVWGYGKGFFPT